MHFVVSEAVEIKTEPHMDFAANIEKARECGWYWGALTSEAAEKILSNEPGKSNLVTYFELCIYIAYRWKLYCPRLE